MASSGYPESLVDATVAKAMDEAFVQQMQMFQQTLAASNKSAQQLSNLTDNIFLQMTQLYQAQASQLVQMNKLAADIMAQRAARDQPNVMPSVIEPVVVKSGP